MLRSSQSHTSQTGKKGIKYLHTYLVFEFRMCLSFTQAVACWVRDKGSVGGVGDRGTDWVPPCVVGDRARCTFCSVRVFDRGAAVLLRVVDPGAVRVSPGQDLRIGRRIEAGPGLPLQRAVPRVEGGEGLQPRQHQGKHDGRPESLHAVSTIDMKSESVNL